jgi:hypothetical protein
MKRQRSRNRGGGSGGNGGKPQHNANRAFDSNGPEGVKVRGAAQGVYEKYQQLARDAGSAGDRVLAENYLQHAEHYFRTVRAMQPQRPVSEIMGSRDQFVSNYDMDYEEEHPVIDVAEAAETDALQTEGGGPEGNRDRNYNDRPRDEYRQNDRQNDRPRDEYRQNRDDRPYRDDRQNGQNGQNGQNRDDRPRDQNRDEYRQRDDRPRDQNRDDRPREEFRPRDDRPRDDRPRDERPRDERPRNERYNRDDRPRNERYNRDDRPRQDRDPLAVVEPQSQPLTATPIAAEPAEGSRYLRGQDGAASEAPAFLQSRPAAPAADAPAEEKKPRRRRAPRTFEGGEAPAAAVEADD